MVAYSIATVSKYVLEEGGEVGGEDGEADGDGGGEEECRDEIAEQD